MVSTPFSCRGLSFLRPKNADLVVSKRCGLVRAPAGPRQALGSSGDGSWSSWPRSRHSRAGSISNDLMNGQPQDGPEVQFKLGEVLRDHGHHPGVMGPWRQLGEDDFFPSYEELDPEQPCAR